MSGTEALQTPAMVCASAFEINGQIVSENDVAILCFEEYNGRVSARYKGCVVYGHWNYEPFKAGEIWCCQLEMNCKTGKNYFARPIQRIDGNFLYALSQDFRHNLSKVLLDHFPEEVRALLKTEAESVDAGDVHEDGSDYAGESESAVQDQPEIGLVNHTPEGPEEDAGCIWRSGIDTIRSELFADGWYDVYISRDHRVLRMRPRQQGGIRCKDHELCIYGLDVLIPLEGSTLRISSINEKTGIIKVSVQ